MQPDESTRALDDHAPNQPERPAQEVEADRAARSDARAPRGWDDRIVTTTRSGSDGEDGAPTPESGAPSRTDAPGQDDPDARGSVDAEGDDAAANAAREPSDDASEADGADAEASASDEEARSGRTPVIIGILAGLLVVSLAAAVTFAVFWLQERDGAGGEGSTAAVGAFMEERVPDVEQTARAVFELLTTYDSTNIEQRPDQVAELSTGNFKDDYRSLIGEPGFKDVIIELKASSRGQIIEGPDVSFRSPTEAVATLRASVITQTKENPAGQTIEYVMSFTLVDTEGAGWKVDEVKLLSEARQAEGAEPLPTP